MHNNPFLYVDPDGCFSWAWLNSDGGRIGLFLLEVAAIESVVGSGCVGIAEGFIQGCSGGITGTAMDLAADAASLCMTEEGASAACATAEATTVSYNVCKTVGRVAGAAFSCTPQGKATQGALNGAKLAVNAVKGAKTATQVASTACKAKTATTVAAKSAQVAKKATQCERFKPVIIEGNRKGGLKHILKRPASDTTEKNVSKFLLGIGRKEISEFANKACETNKNWEVEDNGFHSTIIDMGQIIGTKRDCGSSTSFVKVVFDDNILHTAFPY